jgi:hypothetical protein
MVSGHGELVEPRTTKGRLWLCHPELVEGLLAAFSSQLLNY